jgi:hypothetical protein
MARPVPVKQSISHCGLRAFLCAQGSHSSSFVRAFAHLLEELSATLSNQRVYSLLKYLPSIPAHLLLLLESSRDL